MDDGSRERMVGENPYRAHDEAVPEQWFPTIHSMQCIQ